ncbi:hypothetical protein GGI35DRAFT_492290 [Trichoderma velutinum]
MKVINTDQVPVKKTGSLNDNNYTTALVTRRARTPGSPSRIYFFAKPAHTTRKHMFSVKPVLGTQIQHFDSQGYLEGTIDILSVSYWASWFDKDIRELTRITKCCPELVMMGENFYDVARLSKRLIGAALGKPDTSGSTASLWINNMSFTMCRASESNTYGITIDGKLAVQWRPTLNHTVIDGFELREADKGSLIASFGKDSIEIYQLDDIFDLLSIGFASIQQRTNAEAMVLLTAVWVAYQEGWIFLGAV